MFKAMNPEGVCPPFRHYVHSIEVPPNARWLVMAGQVGTLPDGTIPEGVEAQTEAAWNNVVKILEANGMGIEDIVMVTQYLTRVGDRDAHMAIRDRFLGEHKPASTLLYVSALAQPEMVVEVEIKAAQAVD